MGNTNQTSPSGKRNASLLTYFLSFFGIMMLFGIYKFQHPIFGLFAIFSFYWAYRFYRIAK